MSEEIRDDRELEIEIICDIVKSILDTQVSLEEAEIILNYLNQWRAEKFRIWNES